jgi:hypothetical protein
MNTAGDLVSWRLHMVRDACELLDDDIGPQGTEDSRFRKVRRHAGTVLALGNAIQPKRLDMHTSENGVTAGTAPPRMITVCSSP